MAVEPPAGMKATDFDPDTATPEAWSRFHAYRRKVQAALAPGVSIPPDRVQEDFLRGFAEAGWGIGLLLERDRVVSACYRRAVVPEEGAEPVANVSFSVLPNRPLRAVAAYWLGRVAADMAEVDWSELVVKCTQPDLRALLEELGFVCEATEGASVLDLDGVDWEHVRIWEEELRGSAPGLTLHFFANRVPEEVLEECIHGTADLSGAWGSRPEEARPVLRGMLGEDGCHHVLLARDADGRFVGLTDALYRPDRPDHVQQRFTGVRPEHRGRGVARALKAGMLLRLRELHPEARRVVTSNDTSNAPMLSINRRLGFQPLVETATLRICRDALAATLDG